MLPLPHNLDAERSILGGLLVDARAFDQVADVVEPDDFHHPTHVAIFEAMRALDATSKPIDPLSVAEQMRTDETFAKLRAFNGEVYFAELQTASVTTANISYYARVVRDKATTRRVITLASEIHAKGLRDPDATELLDEAISAIYALASRGHRTAHASLSKLIGPVNREIELRTERGGAVSGIPSGFARLDDLTCGWQPKDLIILAARPSKGKTALALNFAIAAAQVRIPSLIVSIEMGRDSLVERLISCVGQIDGKRLRNGELDRRDWTNLAQASSWLSTAAISIDDPSSPKMPEIRSKVRRWRHEISANSALVILDGLWLINHDRQRGESQNDAVGRSSKALKAMAKDLDVPVIALHQLNRSSEGENRPPRLSDLRDSGNIEQDADVVAFIHAPPKEPGVVDLLIEKQRSGPTGRVKLAFLKAYGRFAALSDREGGEERADRGIR